MRKFLKNTKGAVTVFVTLLLIPAILVSGTAVDLARIHTARSIVQDANQLAANSVLTQYNALLYDLYGLFGVAEDDPVLGQLIDEYIGVSVFGETRQDRSLGTLQLFYGSNISLAELHFADGKNLRNEEVLRRQIEEYMKFRGPVIIVKDIMELLGSSSFKEDMEVISDKLKIDSLIAEIHELYKALSNAIAAADRCNQVNGGIVGGTVGTVSSSLDLIRVQFVSLKAAYQAWENATTQTEKNNVAVRYNAILANIRSRTIGGPVGSNWSNGSWLSTSHPRGLNRTIENAKNHADAFKPRFQTVVNIARQLDRKKNELGQEVNNLEHRINTGTANNELRAALTERTGSPPKSMIERYRDILKWDNIEAMAITYRNGGYNYIDNIMKPLLDSVKYMNHDRPSGASLTRAQLENIISNANFNLSSSILAANSRAAVFADYTRQNITYNVPAGFRRFGDHPGRNQAFFAELNQMINQSNITPTRLYEGQTEARGANPEARQRNMITELVNLVNTAYEGLANEPMGARHINSSTAYKPEKMNVDNIAGSIRQVSNSPVAGVISNPLGSVTRVADYLLLLSYCTSIFSDYTTGRPDTTGRNRSDLSGIDFPKSMRGIPLSPEVNYFFQSELEYLYYGDENAAKNLSAVSRLIFMVRLICNYITVFSVPEVNSVITSIRTAFAWNPPLALILGELARAAFVAAESAVDVATLRAGNRVPLIKSGRRGEWVCSPSGIKAALANIKADTVSDGRNTNDKGLTYSNYLTFFFIARALTNSGAGTELAKRTANLIEWNIINYKNGIFSDEEQMAKAQSDEDRFKLIDMKTDFSLTTTVDMRMLFLSMMFAQNFSDSRGIGMPTTMPVTVTDHRGY